MKCEIIKLFFKSPLHIGEKEGLMEDSNYIIHSDTLFSAICHAFRKLYGKNALEDLLDRFTNNPPFLLSSAFPFFKNNLLFPIPLNFKLPGENFKDYKKLKLIPQELWSEVCEGKTLKKDGYKLIQDKKALLQANIVNVVKNKNYCIWEEKEIQRVSLDRITSTSNIFNFREISFKENSGLFFLINWKDSSLANRIKASIRLLGEDGIGGDTGIGKGTFSPEFGEYDIKDTEGNDYLLLSMFFPSQEEMKDFDGIYDFKLRGGFVFSLDNTTRRKKYVRMITEGSIIKKRKPIGSFVDITPEGFKEHKVYRYGYAFSIPIGG